jgi:hypothetical protein
MWHPLERLCLAERRSVTLPPADIGAVPLDFRAEVNFGRSKATVSEPEAHLAKPLKSADLAQAYREALGQHDQREIHSVKRNRAE